MATLSNGAEFAVQSNLAFRAACNGAVRPEERPIRKRVIQRIGNAVKESPALLDRVLSKLPDGPIDDHLFAVELAKDPSWQTLVSEFLAAEREWNDLLKRSTESKFWKKVLEWIKSFSHKAGDGERPEVKLASALFVTMSGLWAAHTYVFSKPVSVDFTSPKPVHVNLVPGDDKAEFPIGLSFEAPKDPMKVQFVGDLAGGQTPTDALNQIAKQLSEDRRSLENAEQRLTSLTKEQGSAAVDGINKRLENISSKVGAASTNLNQIGEDVASLTRDYDSSTKDQIKASKDASEAFQAQIPILYHALQRSTISVELSKGSSKAVALETFDSDTGKLSAASVKISFARYPVGPNGNSAEITVSSDDSKLKPMTIQKPEGGSTVLEGIGYRLTISGIQPYWVFGHKVLLTLTPEIAPVEHNRPTLTLQAGGQSVPSNPAARTTEP